MSSYSKCRFCGNVDYATFPEPRMCGQCSISYLAGEEAAEARIIKLLEEHIALQIADDTDQDSLDYHEDTCGLCKNFHGLGVAIALIKGEQE